MASKHRSTRRLSSTSKRYTAPSSSSTQAESQKQQAWPVYSFLFVVDSVRANEDRDNGGVAPKHDPDGNWTPPEKLAGFAPKERGMRMYRWSNGVISDAEEYTRTNEIWHDADGNELDIHKCRTMFYANNFHHFRIAEGDTTSYDMDMAEFPYSRWWPLTFDNNNNEQTLSSVNISAESNILAGSAGNAGPFVRQLGLQPYADHEHPQIPVIGGLAGCLAILVGLVAFSCGHGDLNRILLHDRAWRDYRWRGHSRDHGQRSKRGRVISVYYDPANPDFSNYDILHDGLEFSGVTLIQ